MTTVEQVWIGLYNQSYIQCPNNRTYKAFKLYIDRVIYVSWFTWVCYYVDISDDTIDTFISMIKTIVKISSLNA